MATLFQPKFVDLVQNLSTTTGISDFLLGPAANGFSSFVDVLQIGDSFYYSAIGVDNPGDTEIGRGTLLAGAVIIRDPINGKKTNFKSGTKAISLVSAAEWFEMAHALVGSVSPLGQSLLSAASAADARNDLALGHVAVNPGWYGLVDGDDPANGPANSAAFAAMFADIGTTGRFHIAMPPGTFWFAETIDIAVGNLVLDGAAAGGLDEISSILKFPPGVTGIRIQNDQSSGATAKDVLVHSSGGGTVIRNLALEGAFTTTEAEAHGVQLRRKATLENLTIVNFEGDGIHVEADLGAISGSTPPFGNDNCSFISRCTVSGCRDGIRFDGDDSNACTIVMPNINICRRWGISESSFLGNSYFGGQIATNGSSAANDGVSIAASVVSSGGHYYGAIAGQETGASTNAPSGTTADNKWWYYIGPGAPIAGKPAWVSGILVRAGGAVFCDSDAANNYFGGLYAEGDQGKAQLRESCLVSGGTLAEWCYQNPNGTLSAPNLKGNGNYVQAEPCFKTVSGAVSASFGFTGGNALNIAANFVHSTLCPQGYQFQFSQAFSAGGDLRFTFSAGTANAFWVTLANTSIQFGTGAAVPHAFCAPKLTLADNAGSLANARRLCVDAAAPTTGAHAQGEISLRRTGTASDPFASRCLTAGTPGTWQDIYSGLGINPVGYLTGAGGAITQDTDKTTGVTLDALSGQITMSSAELAAGSSVVFLVTNDQVGATDSVSLSLQSGNATPGTYGYQIDAVSAGSFAVCVRNVSAGPLSEALIFNFAVFKGANS